MTIADGWLNGAAQPARRFLSACVLAQGGAAVGVDPRRCARAAVAPGLALQIAGFALA